MTSARRSPSDFLLHLRTHCPLLARRLDGVRGIEADGDTVRVRAPQDGWAFGELKARRALLQTEATRFFGVETSVRLEATPPDPEALPFPVSASKTWNHVCFLAWRARHLFALALRKPRYLDELIPRALGGSGRERRALEELLREPEAETLALCAPADLPPGEDAATWVLPEVMDRLCALARAQSSYAQLVIAFPGDGEAERLEARLLAVKEWGTPLTPGALLQRYTGRLHYVSPSRPPLGARLAALALARGP